MNNDSLIDGNIIEGKAFWSWLHEPNISSNPEWSLHIVPSEIEQHRFKKAGYEMQMEQIDNKDFGLSIFMRRKVKHMDDVLERPLLFDQYKKKLELFERLSNGSNVMVKYNEWESVMLNNKSIKGIDLIAVMLLDKTPSLF